jgi:glycosyltransferase involved in cell wall biosynthesis
MTSDGPVISIVIPNYNSGPVIERALTSIFRQTYRNYQIIVADSSSIDESAAILERFRDRIDVLIREKDSGQADGLNRGFARATGRIYGWLCADDELLPDTFAKVAMLFGNNPAADVVIGACERLYVDGERHIVAPPADALERSEYIDAIDQPSCFWRAEIHKRCGPLDDSYHLAFDWDLWCRMRRNHARAVTTEEVLSRYYFSPTNKTSTSGMQFVKEASRILSNYGPFNGRIASIYRMLFDHFDLHGCYDSPPRAGLARRLVFGVVRSALRAVIGDRLVSGYNWHFAALQARGQQWW